MDCETAQTVSRRSFTAEARVRSKYYKMRGLWWAGGNRTSLLSKTCLDMSDIYWESTTVSGLWDIL
jgi:hypothetical protein